MSEEKEITRFDLDMDGSMEPDENGSWVRYEDVQDAIDDAVEAAIEATILRLRG